MFGASMRALDWPCSSTLSIELVLPDGARHLHEGRQPRGSWPVQPVVEQILGGLGVMGVEDCAEVHLDQVRAEELVVVLLDVGDPEALPSREVLRVLPERPTSSIEGARSLGLPTVPPRVRVVAAVRFIPTREPRRERGWPAAYVEWVEAEHGIRPTFGDEVVDPRGPVCVDEADGCVAFGAELVAKRAHRLLVAPGARPQEPARIAVDDDAQAAISLALARTLMNLLPVSMGQLASRIDHPPSNMMKHSRDVFVLAPEH